MKPIYYTLLSTHYLAYTAFAQVINDSTEQLDTTVIQASSLPLETTPESSLETIRQIPGGSSIIDASEWKTQVIKPQDIFRFDPGVYARSNGTGNDTRLSVRGSGIQRRFGDRGITLLIDGIPANDADGSFYFRAIDPLSLSHIETFRGGNGLAQGANQLGGAINLVQKNGLTHEGTEASVEFGRFDTFRLRLEHGGSSGNWDWHAGYTQFTSDGFRSRQDQNSDHFTLNIGYHWSDQAVTRFYGLLSDSDALLSGSLTQQEFDDDPSQAGTAGFLNAPRNSETDRDLLTVRLGQKTTWETANGLWNFYTNYQYLDFDHLIGFGPARFNSKIDFDIDSFQVGFNGFHNYSFAGLDHKLTVNHSFEYGRNNEDGFSQFIGSPFGPVNPNVTDRENTSTNWKFYLENDTTFAQKHHFIAGLGYILTNRRRNIGSDDQPAGPNDPNSIGFDSNQEGFLGKVGYVYHPTESTQVFANISRSFEAAPFSESTAPGISDPQEAITYEVGARHQSDIFSAEVAVYLSDVSDEFIFFETAPNSGLFAITNEDTTHFGVEAASSINLTNLLGLDTDILYSANFSYQFNDFTFDEGAFEDNQIPGISRHVIASQFSVEADRWSAAITADWLPQGLVVDNANTIETDGFVVVDLNASYAIKENITLFGGISNVFDEEHVSDVVVNPDTFGDPSSTRFINPGDGRSYHIGLRYRF